MKTNFTISIHVVRAICLIILNFAILQSTFTQTVPSCTCGSPINVSLNHEGWARITPAEVLASITSCSDGGLGSVVVMTSMTGGIIPRRDTVDCTHIGKTLYAKYTNADGTNTCWTKITAVKDEIKPTITCPGDMTLNCNQVDNFLPTYSDNCPGGLRLIQVGNDIVGPGCPTPTSVIIRTITKTYVAEDASGNRSTPCTFTIHVRTIPSLGAIVMPPHWDKNPGGMDPLKCNGNWPKLSNGHPAPRRAGASLTLTPDGFRGTGSPTLDGVDLLNNANPVCGIMVSYTDVPIKNNTCITKIIRTWKVIEWSCENRTLPDYPQMIEIVDEAGPVVTNAPDLTLSTSNHKCEAEYTFPQATAFDSCNNVITSSVTVFKDRDYATPYAFVNVTGPRKVTLPAGIHEAIYTVFDGCEKSTKDTIIITVEDNTAPVAICDDIPTIGLNSNGEAWLPASALDDGSFDECQLKSLVVRRMTNTACNTPCPTPTFPGFALIGELGTGAAKRWYYLSQHPATPKIANKMATALGGALVHYNTTGERTSVRKFVNDYAPFIKYFTNGVQRDSSTGIYTLVNALPTDTLRYVVEIDNPCNTFGTHVRFCCTDVNARPQNMVILRAIDASGNFNDCMVGVEIQDKLGPSITCPADRTVFCDFAYDPNDLSRDFGSPTVKDNCAPLATPTETVTDKLSGCRNGTIERKFVIADLGGRRDSCTQIITFLPDPTKAYTGPAPSDWPRDTMIQSCGNLTIGGITPEEHLPARLGSPRLVDGVCSLVGAQYTDEEYAFNNLSGQACLKILRTWTVIDWCKFAPNRDPNGVLYPNTKVLGTNFWMDIQEIKVVDRNAPVFGPLPTSRTFDTFDDQCASGSVTITAKAKDACTKNLRAFVQIDSLADGSINRTVNLNPVVGVNDTNTVSYTFTYPVGRHKAIFTFEDKCGNLSTKEQIFEIVNRKTPSAVVLKGLAASLMNLGNGDGMIDIWAKDFDPDGKSSHPCAGYKIYYSFAPVTQLMSNGEPVLDMNETFTCDDKGVNIVTVYVVAVSPTRQIVQTSVETFVDIQDNATPKICTPVVGRADVSGTLADENNQKVQDVRVDLVGSELHKNTGSDGKFSFSNMPLGGKYLVTPEKNDDPLNGVSTLDLIMIQRHILGIEKLATPYKLIAADINKDGKITAGDLTELRKLILGTTDAFSNNKSWRFVDKAYRFADATSAQGEAFPEIYSINNLNTNMVTDFIAIKTGDINGNAKTNNLQNNTESRSANSLSLYTNDVKFEAGKEVVVPVIVSKSEDISGLQFTLNYDADLLAITSIDPAGININDSHFGFVKTTEGKLTVSWNDTKLTHLSTDQALFNITFIAKNDGQLSDLIKVNSEITKSEAYSVDDKVMNLSFTVIARDKSLAGYDLKQNTPNPFKETTTIGFDLPQAMPAYLTIYDVSGKIIKGVQISGAKGYNAFEINKSELHTGILFYTLKAGDFNATKKMVVLE